MKKRKILLLFIAGICTLVLCSCERNTTIENEETSSAPAAQAGLSESRPAEGVLKDYDSVIDASFKAGRLVLTEEKIALPDPDTCVIEAPPRR